MPLNHTHTLYDPELITNEVEDMYKSHLDLCPFVTIDNSLEGTAGFKKTINTYTATSATQKLAKGEGNTKNIGVAFTPKTYETIMAQSRFPFYDEEVMQDPHVLQVGTARLAADMWATVQDDIMAELQGESNTQKVVATADIFAAFVDAVALLENYEKPEEINAFAFVNPKDVATLRKAAREDLKYVEGFIRHGYIGTIAGVNIYSKNDVTAKTIVGGTKKAVTLFNKKGLEFETERDANVRLNEYYARKYYIAALTDAKECFKIDLNTVAAAKTSSAKA